MKKILAFIFAVGTMCSLSACGNQANKNSNDTSKSNTSETQNQAANEIAEQFAENSNGVQNGTTTLENGSILEISDNSVVHKTTMAEGLSQTISYSFSGDELTSIEVKIDAIDSQLGELEQGKHFYQEQQFTIKESTKNSVTFTATKELVASYKEIYTTKEALINGIKASTSAAAETPIVQDEPDAASSTAQETQTTAPSTK